MYEKEFTIKRGGRKFIFNKVIAATKAQAIVIAISNFTKENNIDLNAEGDNVFEGILTCPVRLIWSSDSIKVILPNAENKFE